MDQQPAPVVRRSAPAISELPRAEVIDSAAAQASKCTGLCRTLSLAILQPAGRKRLPVVSRSLNACKSRCWFQCLAAIMLENSILLSAKSHRQPKAICCSSSQQQKCQVWSSLLAVSPVLMPLFSSGRGPIAGLSACGRQPDASENLSASHLAAAQPINNGRPGCNMLAW